MKPLVFTERRFRGLDLSRDGDDLPDGLLTRADNAVLDGDDLVTRPGKQGQLSSALANALYGFTPITDTDGTPGALFVAGGVLYKWRQGATSASSLSLSGVTSASVQIALAAGLAWLVDGTGTLKRCDLTAAATAVELDRPTAPTVAITSETIASPAALTWTQNYITGTGAEPSTSGAGGTVAPRSSITLKDGNFWDMVGGNPLDQFLLPFWEKDADATASPRTLDGNKDNCIELDSNNNTHEWVLSDPILLNVDNAGSDYAKIFVAEYEAASEDVNTASEVIDFIAKGFTDTGATAELTSAERKRRSPLLPAPGKSLRVRELIDWRGVAASGSPLRSCRLRWEQPNLGGNPGAKVNRVALYIPQQQLALSADADSRVAVRQGSVQVWQGIGAAPAATGQVSGLTDPSANPPGRLLTAGLKISSTLPASKNLSSVRQIGLEVLPGAGVSRLDLRLGFKVGPTWHYSNLLDIPADGGWASVDLGTLAASLTAVTDIALEITNDVIIDGLQEGGTSTVFRVGELRSLGNLAEGRPVWYTLVEMDEAGDSSLLNVIWSDGSKYSQPIEPDTGKRMASLTIPARTNSRAEWMALYRFGGGLLSGVAESASDSLPPSSLPAQGRLVALVRWDSAAIPIGSDADKGTPPRLVALGNPYVSWTPSGSVGNGGTIIDNTPDSFLESAPEYIPGREKAPASPSAVASWDNRLWVAQGAELFASWILEPSKPAGIYWSRIALPSNQDPEAARKGWWTVLDLAPGDSIKTLVSLPSALIVLTSLAAFVVRRDLAGGTVRYRASRLEDDDATGVVGVNAACAMNDACVWLARDGLRRTDGRSVVRFGDQIRRLVQPELVPGVAALSASALALCALRATPTHLYLSLPAASTDTGPVSVVVWHQREQGFTRWSSFPMLGGGDVAGVTVLAASDGQLWAMQGEGDKAGPSSTATAVTISIASRRFGDGYSTLIPQRQWWELFAGEADEATLTTRGDRGAGDSSRILPVDAGNKTIRWRPSTSARGKHLTTELEAATVKRLRVKQAGLETSVYKESDR
jgi:hypothetical protein